MSQVTALLSICSAVPAVSCRAKSKGNGKVDSKRGGPAAVGFGGGVAKMNKEPLWQCVKGCGACCKLNKGPNFASPEEIFDNPSDIQLFKDMTGPDGWCIHYDKSSRTCSMYNDRPYFCRVETDVFLRLYGIKERNFNRAACSACKDTIKSVYGASSEELANFNRAIYE